MNVKNYNNPQAWNEEDDTNLFDNDNNEKSQEWDFLKEVFGYVVETVYWNID